MAWILLRLSNYQQVAPLVRTGGSRHTGLAAPPHRNIQFCHMAHAAGVPDTAPFGRRRAISGLAAPEEGECGQRHQPGGVDGIFFKC